MQNQNQEVRVTAKTLETALGKACDILQLNRDQVDYRIVSQTNGGLFSFLAKKVEIAAWKKRLQKADSPSHNGIKVEDDEFKPELAPSEVAELQEDLRLFCEGICSRISGQSVGVKSALIEDRLILDIDDEYLSSQMIKNSKLAESLEHILRKKPRHLKRELPFRIFVDVNGVRRKREDDLVELAKDLSEKVHENKRPIVLNYKSSYDRKIIHMALDKDERVYTKSIGSGPNRKLMILPIKKKEEGGLSHGEEAGDS